MHRGYVRLWRKSLDNDLIRNSSAWQLMSWCLLKATHKRHKQIVGSAIVELTPGQLIFGRMAAARELGTTERKIRTSLELLKKMDFLTIKTTNKYSVITVVNWGTYQDERPANDQLGDQETTSTRPANDHKQEQRTEEEDISLSTRAGASDPAPPALGEDTGPELPADPPVIDRAAGARLLKIVRPIFEKTWPEAPKVVIEHDEMLMHLAEHIAADPQRAGPEFWEAVAARSRASPFLRGEKAGKQGFFPGMKFAWFVKPDNVGKILNGDFDEAQPKPPSKAPRKETPSGALEIESI